MKHTLTLLTTLLLAVVAPAAVKLPPVFSDHMVLQRDVPAPVWGTADAEEKIVVKFQGQEKTAAADASGKWMVKFDALKVSDQPDKLTVNDLTVSDVLVGDVWLGSGQSNMAGAVRSYVKGDPALEKMAAESYPQVRMMGSGWKGWKVSSPETNLRCSALLFSFGILLQKDIKVPVGLMCGAVGGSPSAAWLSPEMLAADAPCREKIEAYAAANPPEKLQAKYEKALANWPKAVEEAKAKGSTPPGKPSPPPRPGETSGGRVGELFAKHIKPFVPFAIRGVLWDQGEHGTALAGVDQFTLMGALIKGWRNEWGQDFPFLYIQKPSGQGCAFDPNDPITIKASPFGEQPARVPANSAGFDRDVYTRIRNRQNTAMVTTSDLVAGIHPQFKSSYGARAARVALGFAYKRDVEYYGPVYASHKIEGDKVRLGFTHVGKGLVFKGGDKLQGFMIAGEDRKFVCADAIIDGETVVLSAPQVSAPVAVRYAWSVNTQWANLFNQDGLPAQTFRTDGWSLSDGR